MDENEVVIRLENISKTFYTYEKSVDSIRGTVFNLLKLGRHRELDALKGINLEVRRGEFLGILGRNGSGKSTLLKIIMGAMKPNDGGKVEVKGKMIRLALGMGFDPDLSARDNVYLNASLLGLSFKSIGERFEEIIEFAELENFVDTKVKFFSSGMRSRLAFSVAVHAEADIFLMDEFFGGVGDIRFRQKSSQVFRKKLIQGKTIVYVSHNLDSIRNACQRVLLVDRGRQVALGEPEEIIAKYKEIMKSKK